MNNGSLLEVKDLRTYFNTEDGEVRAVDGISFQLKRGETLGIVGESGSGKSVTNLSIIRLIPSPPGRIVSGHVLFDGSDILGLKEDEVRRIRGRRIAMIFQDPMTSLNPFMKISRQLMESRNCTSAIQNTRTMNMLSRCWRRWAFLMRARAWKVIRTSFPEV